MAVSFTVVISYLPISTLLRYFRNKFEMLLVVPVVTGITFVFTFHIRCIFLIRTSYSQIFRLFFDHVLVSFQSQYLLTDMLLSYYTDCDILFVREVSISFYLSIPYNNNNNNNHHHYYYYYY
jgi:hypothetical protein